jgi:hypothetical protein
MIDILKKNSLYFELDSSFNLLFISTSLSDLIIFPSSFDSSNLLRKIIVLPDKKKSNLNISFSISYSLFNNKYHCFLERNNLSISPIPNLYSFKFNKDYDLIFISDSFVNSSFFSFDILSAFGFDYRSIPDFINNIDPIIFGFDINRSTLMYYNISFFIDSNDHLNLYIYDISHLFFSLSISIKNKVISNKNNILSFLSNDLSNDESNLFYTIFNSEHYEKISFLDILSKYEKNIFLTLEKEHYHDLVFDKNKIKTIFFLILDYLDIDFSLSISKKSNSYYFIFISNSLIESNKPSNSINILELYFKEVLHSLFIFDHSNFKIKFELLIPFKRKNFLLK